MGTCFVHRGVVYSISPVAVGGLITMQFLHHGDKCCLLLASTWKLVDYRAFDDSALAGGRRWNWYIKRAAVNIVGPDDWSICCKNGALHHLPRARYPRCHIQSLCIMPWVVWLHKQVSKHLPAPRQTFASHCR